MEFRECLRELRTEKNWTQKMLAAKMNVTDDCVHFWEKGRSEPSVRQIIELSVLFEVTTDYLLGKTDY